MKALRLIALLAGVLVGLYFVESRRSAPQLALGAPAPDFEAVTLDGARRSLGDYRGQVVLLNLWATWCGPCEWEMPSLEALHREFASRGLRVVAVAVDDPGFEDRVRDFVARHGLTFEVLSEGSGKIERVFQARGIPATYLIDRRGILRKRVAGAARWDSDANRALVAQLLGEEPPASEGIR